MFGSKQNQPRRRLGKADRVTQVPTKRPNVFSYRASRSGTSDNLGRGQSRPAEAPTVRPSMKKSRLKRFLVILAFAAALLIVGNNLLLRGSSPDIVILGSGSTYRSSDAYYTAAAKAFGASPFNSNKLTVNVKKIEAQMKQDFPELADVSVSLPIVGRRPTVYLQPSNSSLIMRSSYGESFVLDENGRVTASGDIVGRFKEAGLPEVEDQSQVKYGLGEAAIPSTSVSYITEVVRQLKAKGVEITGMTLLSTPGELQVRVKDANYYVKMTTRGGARVAVGSFLAVKASLETQGKKPNEYIDVRIENRAYYK